MYNTIRVMILTALIASSVSSSAGAQPVDPNARKELRSRILEHIKRVDAIDLRAPDFPEGKEWFNSPPLRFSKELAGKITVLDFWTYCCINCIHILPDLAALEEKYAGYPVAFVGVHSAKFENERVSENIRQAVLRYEITHPVINDDEMSVWRAIGVPSWPTLAVVGPKRNLLLRVSGEGNKDVIDVCIEAALEYYPKEVFRYDPVPMALEREKASGGASRSALRFPGKLAIDGAGKRLFISDSNHNRVVVTDLSGKFIEAIGRGRRGLVDGSYAEARFNLPQGVAYHDGVLWVADAENHALRRVDLRARTVTTVAGNGEQGRDYRGGGSGRAQALSTPWDVVVHDGAVIVAMAGTHQIWTHDIESGVSRVLSGSGRELNLNSSDPLLAAWAQPSGLTIGAGELFVADSESSSIRAIEIDGGATRAIVGGDESNPRNLFAFGDVDGIGGEARLQHVLGVIWIERLKRVAVADTYNHRIKLVDPEKRAVEAWIGSGVAGLKDGVGLAARFSEPSGFAITPDERTLYIADTNNHAIRVLDIDSKRVTTLELTGVPRSMSRDHPRARRLADLPGAVRITSDALVLEPNGEATLRLALSLPAGHEYTKGAGSRWQVLHEEASASLIVIDEAKAAGKLVAGEEVVIPLRGAAAAAKGTVRIEALAYHCKGDSACRVDAIVVDVPIEVVPAGSARKTRSEISVRHAFAGTVEFHKFNGDEK